MENSRSRGGPLLGREGSAGGLRKTAKAAFADTRRARHRSQRLGRLGGAGAKGTLAHLLSLAKFRGLARLIERREKRPRPLGRVGHGEPGANRRHAPRSRLDGRAGV